jgi:hypothetical protein
MSLPSRSSTSTGCASPSRTGRRRRELRRPRVAGRVRAVQGPCGVRPGFRRPRARHDRLARRPRHGARAAVRGGAQEPCDRLRRASVTSRLSGAPGRPEEIENARLARNAPRGHFGTDTCKSAVLDRPERWFSDLTKRVGGVLEHPWCVQSVPGCGVAIACLSAASIHGSGYTTHAKSKRPRGNVGRADRTP